jgi:hypothetical protein
MKSALLIACLIMSNVCAAGSDAFDATFKWLKTWAPQNIEFVVEKSSIKFSGCKQKEYLALIHQPISKNIMLEMGLGYAKGRHSWGVFKQRVSVKQISVIPRYQINHYMSLGMGFVMQSETEFRTSQGIEFNLPQNTEWLVNSRTAGFIDSHYWEWTASSQKWQASNALGAIFENGLTNNKVGLSYNGYF